ncbi:replication/maintenance protein RepL [Limimaricola cinnabarinus]|uniref:replication/maintenance protein RepL n=1 Tax=Limimaricola cinnabarinus TaxID=1125964 RepID=UPI002491E2D8|nr:replication/maintenance protein RepL [Limimaricola cinnabarinus]
MQTSINMDEERKNQNFVQVYPRGWARLRWLMQQNASAAKIYSWIAEHIDPDGGVLVVSQVSMAKALGISEITVRRQTKWMEDHNVMVRIRVGSGVYAYALDPTEVWRAWDTSKEHAVFRTKTLVKKGAQNRQIERRIRMMMQEAEQNPGPEYAFDPETGEISE